MEIRKIKFPGKLFRKKIWVLDNSEESYNYFTNVINFDPIYFIKNGLYGRSIKEILDNIHDETKTVSYIEDDVNICFFIEFIDFKAITYKSYKKGGNCSSYIEQFLYDNSGDLYLVRVYGDI